LDYIYPTQLKSFFSTQCDTTPFLHTFDLDLTPWVEFDLSWGKCEDIINIVKETRNRCYQNEASRGVDTFYDANTYRVDTFELYGIKDPTKYKKANQYHTPELFEQIGCDVTSDFEKHSKLIQDLISMLPYDKIFRIHVNVLPPGGYIMPHKDSQYGDWTRGLLQKIAIPLNLPDGFQFKLWNAGTIPLKVGKLYAINTGNYLHAVINDSNQDRFMLLIKGVPNNLNAYKNLMFNQHPLGC
jgi:hypothetical protein